MLRRAKARELVKKNLVKVGMQVKMIGSTTHLMDNGDTGVVESISKYNNSLNVRVDKSGEISYLSSSEIEVRSSDRRLLLCK